MKHALVSLTGTTLRFDRSGRRLLAIEPDHIAVHEVASGQIARLPIAGARAIAGFDDELWIATRRDELVRVDATGRALATPAPLPFAAHALLVPAPCGPAAAVWSAESPVVLGDGGAIPRSVDVAIPLTGKRCVLARGVRVTLPSGMSLELAPTSTVRGGCVTADGKILAMVIAQTSGRQLVLVSLATAQIVWQGAIASTDTVVVGQAAVVIQVEPRMLRVIDLKANREVSRMVVDADIVALAIDPAGRTIATRAPGGEIALHPLEIGMPRSAAVAITEITLVEPIPPVEEARPNVQFSSRIPELELELVTTNDDDDRSDDLPIVPHAPRVMTCDDLPAENLAMIPRLRAATTIDWIVGGADHQKGYY